MGLNSASHRTAPALVLFAALAAVGLVSSDPDRFAGGGYHSATWNYMTVAGNLTPAHNLLGFYWRVRDADGVHYDAYNRFPIAGYLLIKLAVLPFAADTAALQAARALMLVFFAATAVLAWLAIARLIEDPWVALATVLLAFCSFHALYYADLVAIDAVVALFAVMLAFHGVAIFATTRRFGQLVAKSCAALALDWHVLALIGPLVALGLVAAWRERDGCAARRHFALGAVTVLFAAVMLAVNLAREHAALGGEVALADMPTVESALNRTGINPKRSRSWREFAGQQLNRVGVASVPYVASRAGLNITRPLYSNGKRIVERWYGSLGVVLGAIAFGLVGGVLVLTRPRYRLAFAALAMTGPCWAIVMRYDVIVHEFQGLFYIGLPLTFFALTLPKAANIIGNRRGKPLLVVFAAATFVFSLASMARDVRAPNEAQGTRELLERFDAIRPVFNGKTVLPPDDGHWSENPPLVHYLLRGAIIVDDFDNRHLADFAVDREIEPGSVDGAPALDVSILPNKKRYFLYDIPTQDAALKRIEAEVARRMPAFSTPRCDVHLVRNTRVDDDLVYVCRDCPAFKDVHKAPPFFLHVYPQDDKWLVGGAPFDNLDFRPHWWRANAKCYARKRLPGYAIAEIHTGQFITRGASQTLWEGVLVVDGAARFDYDELRERGTLAASAGDWEMRLLRNGSDADELLYIRHACPDAARFRAEPHVFLHVHPERRDVLDWTRRGVGFENLDFAPSAGLRRHDGKCYWVRRLPNYEIARVRTGQFANEELWAAGFVP